MVMVSAPAASVTDYFRMLYNGLVFEHIVWFAYMDSEDLFENPFFFNFESITSDDTSRENFSIVISPGILPVGFFGGKGQPSSYEFYYPSASAHQLCMGQLPIKPSLADLVKTRGEVTLGVERDRLKNLIPTPISPDLSTWQLISFTTKPYRQWWSEWSKHLFNMLMTVYCKKFDPSFESPEPEKESPVPTKGSTGVEIDYDRPHKVSRIGFKGPSIQDILEGRVEKLVKIITQKRKVLSSKTGQKTKAAKATTSSSAPSVQADIVQPSTDENIPMPIDVRPICREFPPVPGETPMVEVLSDSLASLADPQIPTIAVTSLEDPSGISVHDTDLPHTSSPVTEAQDTPDNSVFSFHVDHEEEDDASSSQTIPAVSEESKEKLQAMLNFLDQNIGQLVQNAKPVRQLLLALKGHLTSEAEEAIIPVPYIEGRQFQVLKAKQRIVDRLQQEQLSKEKASYEAQVADIHNRIDLLNSSRSLIVNEIDRLNAKRAALMKELGEIGNAIVEEEEKFLNLPETIAIIEAEKNTHAREAYRLHKRMKPILGTADADAQEIADVDQIRLCAMDAIRSLLGM
ncbi:hypothetical protein PR202_ga20735 [Eleusine coracana subsp. coracana]|uniref:Aminotransferase-like plant mobile domain-containing protein n=1 Tax=Eleusine coracana subsp. coracana TaxID=191504 RepID=A0AAV5CYI8_ELECO|nr:hypothetical protein PR202_ga20735 [Eleusine coracana subsp. coracana]